MSENTQMIVSSVIFIAAYALIISEKIDRVAVALGGGVLMVLVGILSQTNAFLSIDYNTLGLLISMMVIVMITMRTGVFEYLAIRMIKLAKGEPWKIMVYLAVVTAVISAFLDNVTTILLILPITFGVCKDLKLKPAAFVISQVFASNIGGTATLIGDPPNIMIGSGAGKNFMDFVINVTPVIIIILPVTILAFILVYKKNLKAHDEDKQKVMLLDEKKAIKDRKLLVKASIVLGFTILGFIFHGTLEHLVSNLLNQDVEYPASTVAIAGAVALLLVSRANSEKIFKEVEWKTIFFFSGLFMLVGGIDSAGVLKLIANGIKDITGGNQVLLGLAILWVSAIVSAFVDNIPFTATMIPIIKQIGAAGAINITPLWWALSLGACLGGNGTIIGASANVVATGMMEEMGHRKISFGQYFKVCFPIMLITIVISTIYLLIFFL